MAVRFSPDVISILTTKGCNGSGCHGSPAGQNGFKLSLFGGNPEADYQMIVNAHNGRRIDLPDPEQSLLLKKPSFAIPHGGGRVLPVDSEEYKTILAWLRQGAKLQSGAVSLRKLEVYPPDRVLKAGTTQPLIVIGRLSDGTTRDMTREVRYVSAGDAVARVSTDGVVTAAAHGLSSVVARAMGQVAAAQIGVVPETDHAITATAASNNFIDDLVFAQLRQLQVEPFPLTSDREFIRRVTLDAIGLLPTPEEARAFLADPAPDKRSRLIDRLLARPEYASHWTVKFEDWFRNCQLHNQGRSMGSFKDWLHDQIAADRPWDQFVRDLLTSQGDTILNPAANFWQPSADFMLKKFDATRSRPRSRGFSSECGWNAPNATTIRLKTSRRTTSTASPLSSPGCA
jgi:hypothetical protein